jgi:hypothetical protein
MISTFQGLLVALFVFLPGASYTFAYERVAGSYGITFSDRLVRFLAASAVFHAVFSAPEVLFYRHFVSTNRLQAGNIDLWLVELLAVGYVAVPTAAGSFVGFAHKRHWTWASVLVGEAPEPRAWDYMWRHVEQAILRIKLKSGPWVAGYFGVSEDGQRRSYAAGHPEDGDLYLVHGLKIDPQTGELELTDDNQPSLIEDGRGLLIRWSEIEYIDIWEY